MKIVSKTYLLIAILVVAAIFNLVLLYQDQNSGATQSYSILKAGDVKVKSESIASLATSVASGNDADKPVLERNIEEIQSTLNTLKIGGMINNLPIEKIPTSISSDFNTVTSSWQDYKESVLQVEKTSVFDPEATKALNYLLQKNGELVLLTDELQKELDGLDRDYNRHKQIANELGEYAKAIGQQVLLISIGEEEGAQEKLSTYKLEFEIGIRKLLQISTNDLDVDSVGKEHEDLIEIPRENSKALRKIDPLWESMQSRINILEERALLSPEYDLAKKEMNEKKEILYGNVDSLLQSWNDEVRSQGSEEQSIVQILLVVNIAVFLIVFFVIRQSLSPLEKITNALSRIKEGFYGERIDYQGTDEVADLVNTFNVMSDTIKVKEEDAKKTDIAKDEFLAMITHELKTPLVPIQGYSDILLSEHLGKLTDKQKERINIIKSSSETLLSIISDLLDAQKLELGQLRMKKENANIKDTILKSIESLKPHAIQNNTEIITNAYDIMINHDPERINQVISNLIKNSITAIEGKQGKIEVIMEDLQKEVKISIKDNGIGIPLEKQEDLFKKFYQVDATLTRERGGSGLGLAICKGIIDNHQGTISVQSAPNQGSTFSFTLPKEEISQKSPIGIA